MTELYKENLTAALEYQDFIIEQLRKSSPCIIITPFSSQKYQYEKGESAQGIEIKYDRRMKETGNVYIEVAEKTNEYNENYIASGIYRRDNTWLYLVGDYERALLFQKRQLVYLHKDRKRWERRGIREVKTPTSIGFVYPIQNARNFFCLKYFEFKAP